MEARIARMESDIAHVQSDMGEIKVDLRALRDKVDGMDTRLTNAIASTKTWSFTLYVTLTGVLLGTMARGFGWI